MVNRYRLIALCAVMALYLVACVYISIYVHHSLCRNVIDTVLPDAYVYLKISSHSEFVDVLLDSGNVKNSIVPSAIWWLAGGNWFLVAAVNSLIVYLISVSFLNLAADLHIHPPKAFRSLFFFVFNPFTLLFLVGATKELLTALLMIMFVRASLSRRRIALLALLCLMSLVRFQLAFLLCFVYLMFCLYKRKGFYHTVVLLLLIASIYPFFKDLSLLSPEASAFYRESGAAQGLGAFVEYLRNNVVVVSLLAVLVRVLQSFVEPAMAFIVMVNSAFSGAPVSVYILVEFMSLLFVLPFLFPFLLRSLHFIRRRGLPRSIQYVFGLCVTYLIVVGGFSFVHYRYLYPLFPLLILASLVLYKNRDGRLTRPMLV